MTLDPNWVTAIATSVYGAATLLLAFQIWRDRVQRERHKKREDDARKVSELRCAFYEASGYWLGHRWSVGSVNLDASQAGRQFEALVRLECQLRLNDYRNQANDLGFAIRARLDDIDVQLGRAGTALGLLPTEYRTVSAVGDKVLS